jgi:putative hydrolase of HD superfamily
MVDGFAECDPDADARAAAPQRPHRHDMLPAPPYLPLQAFAMPRFSSPEVVVQRQLDAYNAKDLAGWLATYAPDARQYEHPGRLLAEGHEQIRARTAPRFTEPNLHARLLKRTVMGPVVIDHEDVSRTFPEGPGRIELVCIYLVEDGLIRSASFVFGPQVLDAHQ